MAIHGEENNLAGVRVMRGHRVHIGHLTVAGRVVAGDHGVDLLSDDNGPRVRRTILAFLQAKHVSLTSPQLSACARRAWEAGG